MKSYPLFLGLALMATATFLVGQAAPQGCVTPDMIFPQGQGSTLDADSVDGLDACLQTNASDKKIKSAYVEWVFNTVDCPGEIPVMGVPIDKQFILTDVVLQRDDSTLVMVIREDMSNKLPLRVDPLAKDNVGMASQDPATRSIHFTSGIPFGPGTSIIIQNLTTSTHQAKVTIAGYETSP